MAVVGVVVDVDMPEDLPVAPEEASLAQLLEELSSPRRNSRRCSRALSLSFVVVPPIQPAIGARELLK